MIKDNFDITFEQVGQFQYIIKVITPDKLIFTAPIQCQFMNEEMANQIWSDPNNRKQFFLELETKNDIVKT